MGRAIYMPIEKLVDFSYKRRYCWLVVICVSVFARTIRRDICLSRNQRATTFRPIASGNNYTVHILRNNADDNRVRTSAVFTHIVHRILDVRVLTAPEQQKKKKTKNKKYTRLIGYDRTAALYWI